MEVGKWGYGCGGEWLVERYSLLAFGPLAGKMRVNIYVVIRIGRRSTVKVYCASSVFVIMHMVQ